MNTLVLSNQKGQSVTTSLIVADIFGKEHKNVLQDIRGLNCSDEFHWLNFQPIEYIDSKGRKQIASEFTKDGFSFLVMGYTGAKAGEFKEKFIKEFNNREALLKSDDYIISRAMNLLNDRVKSIEAKNKLLEACNLDNVKKLQEQAPKVLFADSVATSSKSILIGELAKIITQNGYEIGQNRLFMWLRVNKYLGTSGENYNIPNQRFVEQGLFEIKITAIDQPNGTVLVSRTSKVTTKGMQYFVNKFLYKGIMK